MIFSQINTGDEEVWLDLHNPNGQACDSASSCSFSEYTTGSNINLDNTLGTAVNYDVDGGEDKRYLNSFLNIH